MLVKRAGDPIFSQFRKDASTSPMTTISIHVTVSDWELGLWWGGWGCKSVGIRWGSGGDGVWGWGLGYGDGVWGGLSDRQ